VPGLLLLSRGLRAKQHTAFGVGHSMWEEGAGGGGHPKTDRVQLLIAWTAAVWLCL